jgi:hypothetical protein
MIDVSDNGETMCGWRELAVQHLPKLRELILIARSHIDMWQSLKELLSDAGVSEHRKDEVESVYDYAWWCVANSGDKFLATEVATYFYEDLVFTDFNEQMPLYINISQFEQLEPSFRYLFGLDSEGYERFRAQYFTKRGENGPG